MNSKILIRGLALFVFLVLLGVVLKATDLGRIFDEAWIDTDIRGQGWTGYVIFLAVGWAMTACGLPRQLVAFLAGYAFGFVYGTGLSLVAATLGCMTAFSFARLLGRDLVAHRISGRIKRIEDFLGENPFTMTLLIRFLPLGSNFLINLAAGVSRVPALPFIAGSAIGYVPQMVVFALVGSGISLDPVFRISLSAVLFILSGFLGIHLYRKHRHGKTFDDEVGRQLGDVADGDGEGDSGPAGSRPAGRRQAGQG